MDKSQEKALVVNPLNTWWSFQLTLELAFRYKERGYQVFWFNGAVRNKRKFEMNKSDFINPLFYRSPNSIIKQIFHKEEISGVFEYIKIKNKKEIKPQFNDVDDLRQYHYESSPIGAIIFSGIASKLKHTGFSIQEVSKDLSYFMQYSLELKSKLAAQIDEISPQLLITINDRLPGSSLSLAIAQSLNIPTKVFYWGSGMNKIVGYENSLYDYDEWRLMINQKYLKNKIIFSDLKKATTSVQNLASSPSKDSKSFLKYQILGESIIKTKKLIVFYATSEHEHSPLLFRKNNKFLSQYSAFEALQKVSLSLNYQLVIKYHPIRKNIFVKFRKNNFLNDWKKINIHPNVLQLFPNSTVDTYQLIQDADINVTWASTVGKESIARERPTIIMGDTPWLDTNWGIHAWDLETLEKLLKSDSYSLKKEALLPWYYFMQGYGEDFKFVKTLNYNPMVNGIKVLQPRLLFLPFYKLAVKLKQRKLI